MAEVVFESSTNQKTNLTRIPMNDQQRITQLKEDMLAAIHRKDIAAAVR
jgi:hypothetical protein